MTAPISDELKRFRASVHYHFASFFKEKPLAPFAYLVSKKLEEGHICLSLDQLQSEAATLVEPDWRTALLEREGLTGSPFVADGAKADQPFVVHNNRLYLQRYFIYEKQIAGQVLNLAATGAETLATRSRELSAKAKLIEALFGAEVLPAGLSAEEKIHWQLLACLTAYLHNFSIITGGPGTGKTTTVAKLLALLYNETMPPRVLVAAPTGKAAVRLSESLAAANIKAAPEVKQWLGSIQATTIHRLLKPLPRSIHFQHNAANPLRADVIIIDESSMIDVALFAKLLAAVPQNVRLILLGDKDQLASVEAGSLFGDLCQLGQKESGDLINRFAEIPDFSYNAFIKETERQLPPEYLASAGGHPLAGHIVELKFSWRSQSQPLIGQFARWVIRGEADAVSDYIDANAHPQLSIDTAYSDGQFAGFLNNYLAYLDASLLGFDEAKIVEAIRRFNQQKILCAVREGQFGVYATNKKVEDWLKKNLAAFRPSFDYYEHQPIMVTSNNKALGLSNGDIGLIRRDAAGELKAFFIDTSQQVVLPNGNKRPALQAVRLSQLADVETAFAMTIHKSQGSEYEQVLVLLPNAEHNALLTRELLYTAVTRAKKEVLIQSSKEVVIAAVKAKVERVSGIADRFKAASNI